MHEFNCDNCKKLCNNISGGDCVVERQDEKKRVCAKCSEKLQKKGWKETSRARSLQLPL